MSNFTLHGRKLVVDWLFCSAGVTAPARPTTWYLGLGSTVTSSGLGVEVSTLAGYARQVVVWNGPASVGNIDNITSVAFGPAGEHWGEIGAVGIFDAATNGNCIMSRSITPVYVSNTGSVHIAAASARVSVQ